MAKCPNCKKIKCEVCGQKSMKPETKKLLEKCNDCGIITKIMYDTKDGVFCQDHFKNHSSGIVICYEVKVID